MTNCEVITKVDIGSDHRLVIALKVNERVVKLKTTKKQKPFNIKENFESN